MRTFAENKQVMSEEYGRFGNKKNITEIINETYPSAIILDNYKANLEYIKTRPLIEIDNHFFDKKLKRIYSILEIKHTLLGYSNKDERVILQNCEIISYNDLTKAKEQVDLKQSNFTRRERNTIDEMYNYYSKLLEKI